MFSGKCSPSSTNMYNCAMTIVSWRLIKIECTSNWGTKWMSALMKLEKSTAKIPHLHRQIWDSTDRSKGNCLQEEYRCPPQKRNVLQISPWTSPGRAKTRPFWSRLKTIEVSRHVMYRNHRDVPFTEKTQVKYILYVYTYMYIYIYIYIIYVYWYRYRYRYNTRILIRFQAKYLDRSWWIQ